MKRSAPALLTGLLLALQACTSLDAGVVSSVSAVDPATGEKYSQPAVVLPQDNRISAETAIAAGALTKFGHPVTALGLPGKVFSNQFSAVLYIIYDPLAPNWSIQERAVAEDTYQMFLKAKSFRTGGDGESLQIIKRRALQLQRERGYAGYRILDYSDGIESSTPFTHRVSEGTVQLVKVTAPTTAR